MFAEFAEMTMYREVDSAIQSECVMTERHFRSMVGAICGRRISRTRLWELRNEIGMGLEDFTAEAARTMAFYSQQRKCRVPPETAMERTIRFAKENGM